MAYRDPLEAIRHRIAKAREQVAVREERITPTLLEQLPGELVLEQLVPAREATEQEADGVEALQALDEALARYVELLDRIIATAPQLDDEYNRLPTAFPERLAPGRRYVVPDILSHHSVLTTTRPSAPTLRLEPEGLKGLLKKWLRMAQDVQLGSPSFDDAFVVDGSEDAARLLLKPEVCEALLKVAEHSTPTLHVADGVARLEWGQKGHVWGLLEAAIEALVALRQTPPAALLR